MRLTPRHAAALVLTAAVSLHAAAQQVAAASGPWIKARPLLEKALACERLDSVEKFKPAEAALEAAGWNSSQGDAPVTLPQPLQVFGLSTSRIAVSRDGGEQVYRSYLPGVTQAQLVKAAKLKASKDGQQGQSFGRVTKLGVLSASDDAGVTTLTCTIDTEG